MEKDKKAFTLIELLVVVGIIAFFSGFSLALYNRTSDKKLLEGEIRKIQTIIEHTHEKARKNDASICIGNNQNLQIKINKYTLTFNPTQHKIIVSGECLNSTSNSINYNINPRINFNSITNLEFNANTGEIINFTEPITLKFSLKEDQATQKCIKIKTKTVVTEITNCL